MPIIRRRPRRALRKKRAVRRRYGRKAMGRKRIVRNTASLCETFTTSVNDGAMNFLQHQLADLMYDRAQAVAQAYQEFRIKYIVYKFQPSADTFAPAAGNVIPQLYFMLDKANAIPTDASITTLQDMGCQPIRFDNKNIVKAYKPNVLIADKVTITASAAAQVRTSPWLSTNNNSATSAPGWSPSQVDHFGAVFFVTKMNPQTPNIKYNVDVTACFEFRKPLWRIPPPPPGEQAPVAYHNVNGQMVPIQTPQEV